MQTPKNMSKNRHRIPLEIYVFTTVLLLRLLVLARLTSSPFLLPAHGDMHFYNDWALRIVRGHWTDHLAFYGLPLYAYLLAAIYKVFGYSPFLPAFFQACLDSGTAVLVYRSAIKVFGNSSLQPESVFRNRGKVIGLIAALGWGFSQSAQAYSVILMPTSWLVFVFWFLVWQILAREKLPKLGVTLLFGILVGFTAMGVATIFFVVPLLLAAVFFKWESKGKWSRTVAAVSIFLGIGLGASPAFLHNSIVARDPVFLSAHSGVNFGSEIIRGPMAIHISRPVYTLGRKRCYRTLFVERKLPPAIRSSALKLAPIGQPRRRSYVTHNFGAWLKLVGVKVLNFWNAFRYDDLSVITTLREEGITLPGLAYGLIAALAIPGLIIAWRSYRLSRWIAAAILLHMLSLLGVFVTERYRLAAVPGLLLFAAFGAVEFWERCASARFRAALAYAGLLVSCH